jgi:hypothetical protein
MNWIVIVVVWLFVTSGAEAASIEVVGHLDAGGSLVVVDGDMEPGDIQQFSSKVASLSRATVAFRSDGGSLLAGIRIGMLIRMKDFGTVVPEGAQCASACAVAWLGGARRFMGAGSKVGFHAAYILKGHGTAESGPGNAVLGAYLYQLGLSEETIIYVTQAGPTSMRWLNTEEAGQHGIDVALLPPEGSNLIGPVVKEQPEGSLERRATDFVLALAVRWSGPNAEAFRSLDELYADKVRYHGKLVPRQAVVLDKQRFAQRWPERSYTIRSGSISATCADASGVCRVVGIADRVLANAATKAKWRDLASFEYQVAPSGEALQIAAESNSPDKRLEPSGPLNPLTVLGRDLRRLLAKLSRLAQAPTKH